MTSDKVTSDKRAWLEAVPWQKVTSVNAAFCQSQNTPHQLKPDAAEPAQQLWERAASQEMSLNEALECCKHCRELGPFVFNNGNTFASVGKMLMEGLVSALEPVEAQIVRTTVAHYIAGQIDKKELVQVLRHFETKWKTPGTSPRPRPEAEPKHAAEQMGLPQPQVQA
jgi:hypothetical protein